MVNVQAPEISFDNTEIAFARIPTRELRRAQWLFGLMNNRWLVQAGTRMVPLMFRLRLPIKGLVKRTIYAHFCGGENIQEFLHTAAGLAAGGVFAILDYGVEGKESEAEFDRTMDEITRAIHAAGPSGTVKFASLKVTGIARFALLEKKQTGAALTPEEETEWSRVVVRMKKICEAARQESIGIMVDAEESWIQQPVDDLTHEMMQLYNRDQAVVMNTFQLYRTDRLNFLQHSFGLAREGNYLLGAKLVRGAYMEKERKRAQLQGYASPIQPDKEHSDRDYNEAVKFCLQHLEQISVCVASHNEGSNRLALDLAGAMDIPLHHPHLHFSQLLGMSDNLSFNLAHAGAQVTKYVPYGPVKDVVPYLMRRAQENTSVQGQTGRELNLLQRELTRRKRQPKDF